MAIWVKILGVSFRMLDSMDRYDSRVGVESEGFLLH